MILDKRDRERIRDEIAQKKYERQTVGNQTVTVATVLAGSIALGALILSMETWCVILYFIILALSVIVFALFLIKASSQERALNREIKALYKQLTQESQGSVILRDKSRQRE